jgi:hypothetical protein
MARLRNIGIINDQGIIVEHSRLSPTQTYEVLKSLKKILSLYTPREYLNSHSLTCCFPEQYVYLIIRKYEEKLNT